VLPSALWVAGVPDVECDSDLRRSGLSRVWAAIG